MTLKPAQRAWRNQAGSVHAQPNHYSWPVSFDQIQAEVLRAAEEGQRLRVAGSGRSFSPLCWTDENLMSLKNYSGIERWTEGHTRVWVRSGTRMGDLVTELSAKDLALENWQGSLTQTLGGAINTGSLSSSLRFQNLSAQVTGVHLVCADGSARTIDATHNPQMLDAARLSLGALGVITHAELRVVPAYRLLHRMSSGRLYDLLPQLDRQVAQNRALSFRWFPYTGAVQVQTWQDTDQPLTEQNPLRQLRSLAVGTARQWLLTQATRRVPALTPRVQRYATATPDSLESVVPAHPPALPGVTLPWHEIEYALPFTELEAALTQMERVIRALAFPAHLPMEVRFVKGDELWLSPTGGRDCAVIAVRVPQSGEYKNYFTAMAEIADRHDGRPSWGGMHGKTAAELRALYPRFDDFLALRQQLDRRGVFLNPHLSALFGIEQR